MKRFTTSDKTITIIGILSAIAFYVLSCNTPLYMDDYFFTFFAASDELINMPGYEYFTFYTERFADVSRFIPHLAVASFSVLTGKWLFNILSTLGYMLLCWLIAATVSDDRARRLPLMAISAALLWFLIPGFFQGVMWMSGACNYLLVAILVLTFYRLFIHDNQPTVRWWAGPLWFMLGFITGWTNEGFIVGLVAGCTLYFLLNRHKFNGRRVFLYGGLLCGAIPLCLSPLNISRFVSGHSGTFSITGTIADMARSIVALTDIRLTFLLIAIAVIAIIFYRKDLKEGLRRFFRHNSILVTALIVSIIFIILCRHTSANSRFPLEIYSLLLVMTIISGISGKILRITGISLLVVMFASMIIIIPSAITNKKNYQDMQAQIENGLLPVVLKNSPLSKFESRYIKSFYNGAIYSNINLVGNRIIEYYNGNPETVFIPSEIETNFSDIPSWSSVYLPSWEMRFVKLPSEKTIDKVTFILNPADLSIWQRPFARFFSSLTADSIDTGGYDILSVPPTENHTSAERWLVVYDNSAIVDRIRNIKLTVH